MGRPRPVVPRCLLEDPFAALDGEFDELSSPGDAAADCLPGGDDGLDMLGGLDVHDLSACGGGGMGAVGEDCVGVDGALGDDGSDEDESNAFLYAFALTVLFRWGDGESRAVWNRDNGQTWLSRLTERGDQYFYKRMRMTPASFEFLLSRAQPFLHCDGDGVVGLVPSIEPRIRLLVVLFWLGQGGSQFEACEVADMANSTFSPIVREVLRAIQCALPPPHFPRTEAGQAAVAARFESRLNCKIRRVAGVIDGCLILIRTPPARYKTAFNTRKCFYGVILLAIVDADKRFIMTRSGVRGSMADSRAFKESAWYERQTGSSPVLCPHYILLADGGFALETWLLKPYPENQLTKERRRMFNRFLCSPRAVVENAFGVLKGRWRVLHSGISTETELVPHVIEACVRLHNFFLDQGDGWEDTMDSREDDDGSTAADAIEGDDYELALQMREELADELWEVYHE